MTTPVIDFATQGNSRESEQHALQAMIASELRALGFPDQSFDIQASFLTFSPMDLGIRLVWPVAIQFQGAPTGVVQIASPKKRWNPESRVVVTFARIMDPPQLKKEIKSWVEVQAAMVREAYEKRGGEWPRSWPRLQVRGSGTVAAMPVKASTIQTASKVHRRARG